jgi:hypothetical protein
MLLQLSCHLSKTDVMRDCVLRGRGGDV